MTRLVVFLACAVVALAGCETGTAPLTPAPRPTARPTFVPARTPGVARTSIARTLTPVPDPPMASTATNRTVTP